MTTGGVRQHRMGEDKGSGRLGVAVAAMVAAAGQGVEYFMLSEEEESSMSLIFP